MTETEDAVVRHYSRGGLEQAILEGLRALGRAPETAAPEDLAAVDEFHMGGPAATAALAEQLDLGPGMRVLDIGSGLGGPARFFARTRGCAVEGIDLTPDYVAVADALTRLAKLDAQVRFRRGSALALPFDDGAFDAVTLVHVGMNIADKERLAQEAARVLRPGGRFGVYDVMRVGDGALSFPVAWAADETTSFLAAPESYRRALAQAGFAIESEADRRDMALPLFHRMRARIAESGPPPLGLHILMGRDSPQKLANMIAALEQGVIAPVAMVAKKRA